VHLAHLQMFVGLLKGGAGRAWDRIWWSDNFDIYESWFSSVMLLALMKRVDTFLGSQEGGAADANQRILHWRWPRCKIYDSYSFQTIDATKSRQTFWDDRINEVYVYEGSRQCYITYRYVTYLLSPALPSDVDVNSIWNITTRGGDLTKTPLKIGNQSFQMEKFHDIFPWWESSLSQKIRPGYIVQDIPCEY
jgi:hypothetical protein